MTYNKPDNITYTEMCIYFDNHIYEPNRNDTLLFQYLYHIIYMLACKKKFFTSWDDYDAFAIYMADKVYLRFINPEHQGDGEKIKSVLNYCKTILYPTKVDYQKESYATIYGSDPKDDNDYSILKDDLVIGIQESYRDVDRIAEDLLVQFKNISKIIWKEVYKLSHSHEPVLCQRLYMSTLITLVKGLTLSNSNKLKIQHREEKGLDIENVLLESLVKEKESSVTLWRLGPVYNNMVAMLAARTRSQCSKEIIKIRKEYDLSEDDVEAVLASAYGNVARDDNEEN